MRRDRGWLACRVVAADADARTLIDRFQAMFRSRTVVDLDPWIADAGCSLPVSFVRGIQNDLAAVRAAMTEPLVKR